MQELKYPKKNKNSLLNILKMCYTYFYGLPYKTIIK